MRKLWITAVAGAMALSLTACGRGGATMPVGAQAAAAGGAAALSTATLKEGFKRVYSAAFARHDANGDGAIDEYEAGPFFQLNVFAKADQNKDGKLGPAEFLDHASRSGLFGLFRQDADDFFKSTRRSLGSAFKKLDANKDNLLEAKELSDAAIARAKVSVTLPGLKVTVTLKEIDEASFGASDHTKDGKLSQAEFEDAAIEGWVALLNPAGPAPSTPAAPPVMP